MFNPYIEAEKINKIISEFVDQHKVTKDNALKWLTYTRTIKSSLDIIHNESITKIIDNNEKNRLIDKYKKDRLIDK